MASQKMTTRERLLQAAIREFAEKGLDNANLRDICALAEVNLNAVRYHFGGKEGLYVAAVESANRSVMGEVKKETLDESAPAKQRLRAIISEMLEVSMSDRNRSTPEEKLMLREILDPTKATEHIARSHAKPMFDRLNRVLVEMLPAATPKHEQIMLSLSVIGQCMHFKFGQQMDRLVISRTEYKKLTISRLTEHIYEVTLATIEQRNNFEGREQSEN